MRFNLIRISTRSGTHDIRNVFVHYYVNKYSEEYLIDAKLALQYIRQGNEGLDSFVDFLSSQEYDATTYVLRPNTIIFRSSIYDEDTLKSPSFGFIISDDNPKLVEFKLKHVEY